jgi:hypothetical protein
MKTVIQYLNDQTGKARAVQLPISHWTRALGSGTSKIRLAVRSKGKGKSGGMRIITFTIDRNKEVYLLTIYDKSEIASIDDRAIKFLIRQITED